MPIGEQKREEGGEEEEDGTGESDLGKKLFNQVTPRSEPDTLFPSPTNFLVISKPQSTKRAKSAIILLMKTVSHKRACALTKTAFHVSTHTVCYSTPASFSKEFFPQLLLHCSSHGCPWPLNKVEVWTSNEEQRGYMIPNDWSLRPS